MSATKMLRATNSLCAVLLLLAACSLHAVAQAQTTQQPSLAQQPSVAAPQPVAQSPKDAAAPEPLIGGGDLLNVSVYGAQDFQYETRVNSSGEISLPMIGLVHVAEMSSGQAATVVAKKLADGKFFNDPHVSVFIKEYATQGVSVLGEVQKPGVYPVLGSRRLFDAISMAGGLTPKASSTVAITHRGTGAPPAEILLVSDPVKSAESNVPVFPGDTILVGKAGIVYVVGDVRTPGGYVIDNASSMTVLKAIAMAQGTNSTAKLDHAKLVRKTPQGSQEFPLPLKQIMSQKAPDMALRPDDIVFVPTSAAKNAARRGIEAILQTASGMAIYARPF